MPFRVAISGLRAATNDLNVIGNNVSNANTTGFKRARAEFADVHAVAGLGAGANAPGGGVNLERIAQQFTQGNVSFTDNGLDLAISGKGFFVLDDNGTNVYSRAGAFGLDRNGQVVNAQGQALTVFRTDGNDNVTGATAPLTLSNSIIEPQASTGIDLELNLNSEAQPPAIPFDPNDSASFNASTSTTVYDSLGNSHLASTYYVKTAAPNTWEAYLLVDGAQVDGPDTLTFSDTGALVSPPAGTVTSPAFTPAGSGAAPMQLTLDYGSTTQFGAPFSVLSVTQDGFTTGQMTGIDIDAEGLVFARFSNGQSQLQGQVALANFPNEQGLQPLGDNNWAETFNSGTGVLAAPGTSSLGLVQAGALEDSNVDIAEELVDMIVAQRNYQANAEVISTADAVTQSIINIR